MSYLLNVGLTSPPPLPPRVQCLGKGLLRNRIMRITDPISKAASVSVLVAAHQNPLQGIYPAKGVEISRCFPGWSAEISRCFPGWSAEISRCFPGWSAEISRCFPGWSAEISRCFPRLECRDLALFPRLECRDLAVFPVLMCAGGAQTTCRTCDG